MSSDPTTTHASLARAPRLAAETAAPMLLEPAGASVILGWRAGFRVEPLAPAADSLFGPRGACLASPDGPLLVCDTGHHRLLIWRQRPIADLAPADLLIGQRDFGSEGRNGRQAIGAATLNVPTGVACAGGILAVADAWNHRVLVWHGVPDRSNQPADVVLGQSDFSGGLANRGSDRTRADTLSWPYGVALAEGRLIVADTGNRRVLLWDRVPTEHGTPADLVLGQRDFGSRDENGGASASATSMRWPHAICQWGEKLFVADAGNNRVMIWNAPPVRNGQPCDAVLGQSDLHSVDHNQAAYAPTESTLNMPYGVTVLGERLIVADTANSRLLGFARSHLATGSAARWLAAQPRFSDKGDNRWSFAARDSVCWPYGVAATGETLVVADAGNNRVLLWPGARVA